MGRGQRALGQLSSPGDNAEHGASPVFGVCSQGKERPGPPNLLSSVDHHTYESDEYRPGGNSFSGSRTRIPRRQLW